MPIMLWKRAIFELSTFLSTVRKQSPHTDVHTLSTGYFSPIPITYPPTFALRREILERLRDHAFDAIGQVICCLIPDPVDAVQYRCVISLVEPANVRGCISEVLVGHVPYCMPGIDDRLRPATPSDLFDRHAGRLRDCRFYLLQSFRQHIPVVGPSPRHSRRSCHLYHGAFLLPARLVIRLNRPPLLSGAQSSPGSLL